MIMSEEERARKEEKIRKCLRLSKSAEPHEAAAAMRHAQALMRELGIDSEDEVGAEAIEGELVIMKGCVSPDNKVFTYIDAICSMIGDAFGVFPVIETRNKISANMTTIRYIGPRSRVLLATYAHRCIDRACFDAWTRISHTLRGRRGAQKSFQLTFVFEVKKKVEKISPTSSEEASVAKYENQKYLGGLSKSDAVSVGDIDPLAAGRAADAARQFDLNRPMGMNQRAIGNV